MKTRNCLCWMFRFGAIMLGVSCKPEEEPLYGRAGDLLEEGKVWSELHIWEVMPGCEWFAETTLFWIEGDTVIEGRVWKKYYYAAKDSAPGLSSPAIRGEQGVAVVRVYDTVLTGGRGRLLRAMDVVALEGGDAGRWAGVRQVKDTWVEGIGSLTGGLNLVFREDGWSGWQTMDFILCCGKGDELLYQNSVFGTCRIDDFKDIPDGLCPAEKPGEPKKNKISVRIG